MIIMGDLNARAIQVEDEEEKHVIGTATVKGRSASVGAMSAGTERN